MMAAAEKERFTFTWQIENFSMCPYYFCEPVSSPAFVVDFLPNMTERLILYPRGKIDRNYLSCYLGVTETPSGETKTHTSVTKTPTNVTKTPTGFGIQTSAGFGTSTGGFGTSTGGFGTSTGGFGTSTGGFSYAPVATVTSTGGFNFEGTSRTVNSNSVCSIGIEIGFSLTVLSENIDKTVKKEIPSYSFRGNDLQGFDSFIKRSDVFESANGMLPNDTLTIICCLWRVPVKPNTIQTSIPNTLNNCRSSKTLKCSAVTRIPVSSKSFLFHIKRISALQPGVTVLRNVEFPIQCDISISMKFDLNVGDQCARIVICIKAADANKHIFVRAKIKTIGSPKNIQFRQEDEHYFVDAKNDVWQFPTFIKLKDLMDRKYLHFTNDALLLHCEFFYSAQKDVHSSLKSENFPVFTYCVKRSSCLSSPRNDNLSLYRSGQFSDVTIRAGTKTFNVHKNILGLKSDVFSVMFESDMQEKANGVIEITDFDPDTVERLLTFMYSDSLPELNHEDAVKLYAIADKYNIVPLKCHCCCALIATLSESNICEVLALTDLHPDEDLLEAVWGFIRMNWKEIARSQKWKEFTQNNTQFASDVMLQILSKGCFV